MRPVFKHTAYILSLFILAFAYIYYPSYSYEDRIFERDQLSQTPMIQMEQDPTLFPTDEIFHQWRTMFRTIFYPFVAWMATLLGSIKAAYFILSIVMGLIFLFGVYLLVYEITKNRFVSALVSFFSIFPRASFGGIVWAFPDSANFFTRHIVVNFVPLLFFWFLRIRGRRTLVLLFLVLGLFGNIHPLTAAHLAALFSVTFLFLGRKNLPGTVKTLVYSLVAFVVGLSPYLVSGPAALQPIFGRAAPPIEIFQFRAGSLLIPGFRTIRWVGFYLTIPVLLAIPGFLKARTDPSFRHRETLVILLGSILVLSIVGNLAVQTSNNLLRLQPIRIFVYIYLVLFCYAAVTLKELLDKKRWKTFAVCGLLLLVPFNSLEGMIKEWRGKPGKIYSYQRDGKFLDLAAWAEANTDRDDLFLTPLDMSAFRIYAKRGIVVSMKGGGVSIMSKDFAMEWWKRYQDLNEVYTGGDTDLFLKVAVRYGAKYIVTPRGKSLAVPLEFGNDGFNVYRVPSAPPEEGR